MKAKMKTRILIRELVLCIAATSCCAPALGITQFWVGAANGYEWSNPSNWSYGGLGSGDSADIWDMGHIDATQSLDANYYLTDITFESTVVNSLQANHTTVGPADRRLELAGTTSGKLITVDQVSPAGVVAIGNEYSLYGLLTTQLDTLGEITTNTGTALLLSGEVTGLGGIIKTGNGTLYLEPPIGAAAAQNSYAGGFSLSSGTVEVKENASVLTNPGSAIWYYPLGFGSVNLGGGTLSSADSNPCPIANNVNISSSVTLGAPDKGPLEFVGESFAIDNDSSIITTASDIYIAGVLEGHALIKNGAGSLYLSGINTYTGGTSVQDGVLFVSADNNLGAASTPITLDGGTVAVTGSGIATSRGISIGANSGGISVAASGNVILSGIVSGVGSLVSTGSGTLSLSGANTYSGGTLVTGGGALSISADSALGDSSGVVELDDGILRFNAAAAIGGSRVIGVSSNVGAIDTNGNDVVINAPIVDLSTNNAQMMAQLRGGSFQSSTMQVDPAYGILAKFGVGTLTLATANYYTGGTVISAGTIKLADAGAYPSGTPLILGSGATSGVLDLGGYNATVDSLSTSGTGTANTIGNSSTTSASTITFAGGSGTSTFNGTIQDTLGSGTKTVALTVSSGTLTLTGISTFKGVGISGGALQVSSGGKLSLSAVITVSPGGNLQIKGGSVSAPQMFLYGPTSLDGNPDGTGASLNCSAGNEIINNTTFSQSGGKNSSSGNVIVGSLGASNYNLVSGVLSCNKLTVGGVGHFSSNFTQSGGSITVGTLAMAQSNSVTGTYSLRGGSIDAGGEGVCSMPSTGTTGSIIQSGGSNIISNNLVIGTTTGTDENASYSLTGGALEVDGTLLNRGTFNYTGGDITGNVDNHGDFIVDPTAGGYLYVQGDFNNESDGTLKVYNNALVVTGTMTCNGTYNSDPADNYFSSMKNGRKSAVKGSIGDHFFISNDLLSKSRNRENWNTQLAALIFDGGDGHHVLDVNGIDMGISWDGYENNFSWGVISLAPGESLDVIKRDYCHERAGLYVGILRLADGLAQLDNIHARRVNIYYDAELNPWFNDQAFTFAGGGKLIPIDGYHPLSQQFTLAIAALPEPTTGAQLAAMAMFMARRRRNMG